METLITIGGSVKTAGDNSKAVEGYLVRFTTENDTDITRLRDYFTKSTDFDIERSNQISMYYDHCLDPVMKKTRIGQVTAEVDDIGVYVKGEVDCVSEFKSYMQTLPDDVKVQAWAAKQLKAREDYEQAILKMAREGKLGWSSGTATHLVQREKKSNGANEIRKWPLGLDASLTPTPAEPRNAAAIKSLSDYISDKEQPAMKPELKGLFADTLQECMSPWTLQDALYTALHKIHEAVEGAGVLGQAMDATALVDSVLAEYNLSLRKWAIAYVGCCEDGENEDGEAMDASTLSAAKTLQAAGVALNSLKGKLENDLPIDNHTSAVEYAVSEFAKNGQIVTDIVEAMGTRWEARNEARIKSGRAISKANKDRMQKACGKLKACHEMMSAVHDELMSMSASNDEPDNDGKKNAALPFVAGAVEAEENFKLLAAKEYLKDMRFSGEAFLHHVLVDGRHLNPSAFKMSLILKASETEIRF